MIDFNKIEARLASHLANNFSNTVLFTAEECKVLHEVVTLYNLTVKEHGNIKNAAYTAGYKDGINYICDTLVDEIKEIIEKSIKDGKSDYDLGTNYGLMKCAQIVDQVITEKRSKL